MNRCRELGATDELCLGSRQVGESEIPGGKCVTVPLVATTITLGLLPWLLLDLTSPAVDLLLGLGRGVV